MKHETIKITAMNQEATLRTYLLDNFEEIDPLRKRPLVIICPGGAYMGTSQREDEAIAIRLISMGIHAATLKYSVAPATFPIALAQLATAVAHVRQNAQEWNVDEANISVLGFSAGGHLAASLGVFWNSPVLAEALPNFTPQQIRPNRMVLCYAVISAFEFSHDGSFKNLLGERYDDEKKRRFVSLESQVSKDTPPTFLWHTSADTAVPPQNSMMFASSLLRNNIPCEFHLYPNGCHGLALASEETSAPNKSDFIVPSCENWIEMAARFLTMEL